MNLENKKLLTSDNFEIVKGKMFCKKCEKEIKDCECLDIEERLQNSGMLYRICKICGKHYYRCKCEYPIWTANLENNYLPGEYKNNKELSKSEKYDLLVNLSNIDQKKCCSDTRCSIYDICNENDFCYILKIIIEKIDKMELKNE